MNKLSAFLTFNADSSLGKVSISTVTEKDQKIVEEGLKRLLKPRFLWFRRLLKKGLVFLACWGVLPWPWIDKLFCLFKLRGNL